MMSVSPPATADRPSAGIAPAACEVDEKRIAVERFRHEMGGSRDWPPAGPWPMSPSTR